MFKINDKVRILDFRNIPPSGVNPQWNIDMVKEIGSTQIIEYINKDDEIVRFKDIDYIYSFSWIETIDNTHRTEKLL